MKRKVVLATIVLSVVVVAASLFVLSPNEKLQTPSEKLILRASDMPLTGWSDSPFGPGFFVPFNGSIDCFGNEFYRASYRHGLVWRATLYLTHFGSNDTADARMQFWKNASQSETNITVDLGGNTMGVLYPNAYQTVDPGDQVLQQVDVLDFSKGTYYCVIHFRWVAGYEISYNEMIGLAKAQADKLPD